MKRKKKSSFVRWIDTEGIDEIVRLMKVRHATVYVWRSGKNYPRIQQMQKIKRLTHGKVSYDSIIDGQD